MEEEKTEIPTLIVKTMTDRLITIELSPEIQTIANVKACLERLEALPATKQTLLSDGRVLADKEPLPSPLKTIYLFHYEPAALLLDPIQTAADWDTKNRLKVFRGVYLFSIRRFKEAASLLIDSLTTFTETGFISFKECVRYATTAGMLVLDRPGILEKLIKSPEVLEVINDLPHLDAFTNAFYHCRYREFFLALASIEAEFDKDWLISPHTQFIIKEMRIRSYNQILHSYRSLTLASMAQSFGVSTDYIDREISRFIAAGRIDCIIDKVAGIVITNPPDQRNLEYQMLLKHGDALVLRMESLGRISSY